MRFLSLSLAIESRINLKNCLLLCIVAVKFIQLLLRYEQLYTLSSGGSRPKAGERGEKGVGRELNKS